LNFLEVSGINTNKKGKIIMKKRSVLLVVFLIIALFANGDDLIVIEPQFNDAGSFSEGLAAVKINGEWGFIDKTGKLIIEPQFDRAGSFFEGLAAVNIGGKFNEEKYLFEGGKWGFIRNPLE